MGAHVMSLADRIARLEARRPPVRHDPITAAALDLLDGDELTEIDGLFKAHGVGWTDELPPAAQARVVELLDGAKARAVQSGNPATAGAAAA